ncbi:hypothetical protein ACGFYQ_24420 [Streptomyces sp. NPDC048258]|uniref:hypothetical protein n=1 Tax=Streptomyces sp. NPDC048258 TaxID=3365527 RepID=UPI00371C7EBB
MSTDEWAALQGELGAPPPDSFRALAAGEQARLTEALRGERARRADGLNEAAEEALKLVPGLARGAVRKVLFR